MNDIIKLNNGEEIHLFDVVKKVPATSNESEVNARVCCLYAKRRYPDVNSEEYKVYTNFLYNKSNICKCIAGVIFLVTNKVWDVSEIQSNYFIEELNEEFGIDLNIVGEYKVSDLVDGSFRKTFILKSISHRGFRLFQSLKKYDNIIRTWVDVSEELYEKEFANSLLLVYPFPINIKRQFRYIKHIKKTKRDWTLCGLPYSIKDTLSLVFSSKDLDQLYTEAENRAYKKHAKELLKVGVKKFMSSDEFEMAGFVLHKYLSKQNVVTVNRAHGVGYRCPFVYYNEFKVVNNAQANYYKKRCATINFITGSRIELNNRGKIANFDNCPLSVIFIQSNFEWSGLMYEAELEYDAIRQMQKVCEKMGIIFKVKHHPNCSESIVQKLVNYSNNNLLEDVTLLEKTNPLFFTLYSTTYYDYYFKGPFLFITDNVLKANHFFGDEVTNVELHKLESTIQPYTEQKFYDSALDQQINKIHVEMDLTNK